MDQNINIGHCIAQLLLEQEYVIVPGLGGFISSYTPAYIDHSLSLVIPPSKQIAFNDRLTTEDTKLYSLVTEKDSVSLLGAEKKVADFVANVKAELLDKKSSIIEGLGTLTKADDHIIYFTPQNKTNFLLESFGLPELLLPAISYQKERDYILKPKDRPAMNTDEVVSEPEAERPYTPVPRKRFNMGTVALYILTPVVLVSLTLLYMFVTPDGQQMLAGMNILQAQQDTLKQTVVDEIRNAQPTVVTVTQGQAESFDNAVSAEETLKKEETTQWTEPVAESNKQEEIAQKADVDLSVGTIIEGKSGRCFIIVGGFGSVKNATKLREKLIMDGHESKIIAPAKGANLYRVTLGDYETKVEAMSKMDQLQPGFPEKLWVMVY